MPYKVNGPNWKKALAARREAQLRYNASEKGKAARERAKKKVRRATQAPLEELSTYERMPNAKADAAVILPKPRLEARWMKGVWYEDDPRASILWPETPRLTELLAQRGLIGLR